MLSSEEMLSCSVAVVQSWFVQLRSPLGVGTPSFGDDCCEGVGHRCTKSRDSPGEGDAENKENSQSEVIRRPSAVLRKFLGPLFLWSRMEDWVSVERLYRGRCAHSCL